MVEESRGRQQRGALTEWAARRAFTLVLVACAFSNQARAACDDYDRQKLKDPPVELLPMVALQNCLNYTAIALSVGPDSAELVAQAVVIACDTEAIADAKQDEKTVQIPFEEGLASLRTYVHAQALLAVIKARAEKCAPANSN